MDNITAVIITKNNEDTISECIESIRELCDPIIVFDRNSDDKTVQLCKNQACEITQTLEKDQSKILNNLTYNEWLLYFEPTDILKQHNLQDLNKNTSYKFMVLREGVLTKEIRLWHKHLNLKFTNFVFPKADHNNSTCLDCLVKSTHQDYTNEINEWFKICPTNPASNYYKTMLSLQNKKIKEFLTNSTTYLFYEKNKDISYYMVKYYRAMVFAFKKDTNSAVNEIKECLSIFPDMAEFWCLMGDILYKEKKYKDAKICYEKAIELGKSRDLKDDLPMDIVKYQEYPQKLLDSCDKILTHSKTYVT